MKPVQFYTKKKCPLCDQAYQILIELQKELNFPIEKRDIHEKDEWLETYGLMIPVIRVNGVDLDYGMVHKSRLRKRLLQLFRKFS